MRRLFVCLFVCFPFVRISKIWTGDNCSYEAWFIPKLAYFSFVSLTKKSVAAKQLVPMTPHIWHKIIRTQSIGNFQARKAYTTEDRRSPPYKISRKESSLDRWT